LEGSDDGDEMAEEDEEELEGKGGNGVEDKFLKTKHLEEFLEQAEEEEYGGGAKRGEKKKATENWVVEDSDYEGMDEDEDEDDNQDEDELNVRNL
jgi:U3 small nucleolar RNA-associated protein MPP10